MNQRLDTNKSYGTIFGHSYAAFEQDGALFDGAGYPVLPEATEDADSDNENRPDLGMSALAEKNSIIDVEAYIRDMLKGGPVLQANINRAVEIDKLSWDEVTRTATRIGVTKRNSKGQMTWKLSQK